ACSARPRRLRPFPTRRSSDLAAAAPPGVERSAAPPPTSAPLPAHGPSGRAAPALCSWYGTSPLLFGVARSRGGPAPAPPTARSRSEEHTSELQSRENLVCRLL